MPSVMNSLNVMNIYDHNMLLVTGVEVLFASKIVRPGETGLCLKIPGMCLVLEQDSSLSPTT